jgi:hypothetical protein
MADNRTLLQKADLAVSDLITDGGYLLPDQAATLVQGVVDQAVLMGMIDVRSIASHTQSIGKIAIDGHVLRPGNSGRRLTTTERVKPTTDEVELATKLYKAQINLNDETVEDAVGGGTLTSLVQSMLQEYIAWDLDQLLAAGDTASTDAFLAMMDGLIKLATSNTVNASDNYLSKTYLRNGLLAMPSKYSKDKARQRWLTSTDQEIRYRDAVSDRIGALGDVSLQDENPLRYGGRPLLGIPAFPSNIGTSLHCTAVLLLDPMLARFGIWRQIRMETDRDIESGEWICVATLRAGLQYVEETGVVKIYNVKDA